jgi:hypothetical protein
VDNKTQQNTTYIEQQCEKNPPTSFPSSLYCLESFFFIFFILSYQRNLIMRPFVLEDAILNLEFFFIILHRAVFSSNLLTHCQRCGAWTEFAAGVAQFSLVNFFLLANGINTNFISRVER